MASPLPSLSVILSSDAGPESPLAQTLSLLFEPTDTLLDILVPQLVTKLRGTEPIQTYAQLLDQATDIINSWDTSNRAQFIHGHPRIGAPKVSSNLSAQEQGLQTTQKSEIPEGVIERLSFLNRCYERRYPGLIYITFVNGRSRVQIKDELEEFLQTEDALAINEEAVEDIMPLDIAGSKWQSELDRAIVDCSKIAESRLEKLGEK